MNTKIRTLVVCLIAAYLAEMTATASAQTVFETTDVHAVAPSTDSHMRGGFIRGGRYEARNATMVDLIGAAYGVDADKVAGGPNWMDTDRFDVIAKAPANTTPEALRLMLQALLADRFKLIVHMDTRPFPAYVLAAGKHPRLKQAARAGEGGCQSIPRGTEISCRNVTMAQFAAQLPRMAGDYLHGNPVVDLTELRGSWDFTLQWTGRNRLAAIGSSGVSIYDAVDKQLGLRLDVKKIPMAVIAVGGVNEKPTPNLPGVPQSLPPVPMEFEAAVIKPSAPGSKQRSVRIEPGGRIDLRDFTLKELIKFAWDFQDNDVKDNDDMLVGAPKWTERFDITARPADSGMSDRDSLHLMLRALLVDRFKLATHYENRPVSVYELVAAGAKLKKAEPSNRPGCRQAPAPLGTITASAIFSVTCLNTTMAQLAAELQPMGGIYIPHPVIDATGLVGTWDFVLSWSPPHLIDRATPGAEPAATPGAADPNGGLTLVEALEKQLGLKLKPAKRPLPVLVIDHVEQAPTDN